MEIPDPMTDRNWGIRYLHGNRTSAPNPVVTVSERQDKVLYGPNGAILVRLVDRPIGFHGVGR